MTDLEIAIQKLVIVAVREEMTKSPTPSLEQENKKLIRENYELKLALKEIIFHHSRPHPDRKTHLWGGETGNAVINEYLKLVGLESKNTSLAIAS